MKKIIHFSFLLLILSSFWGCTHSKKILIEELSIAPSSLTLQEGDTARLSVQLLPMGVKEKILFTSSQPKIADVDDRGLVTAIAKGETTILVKAGSLSRECPIKVIERKKGEENTKIELLKKEYTLLVGGIEKILYRVKPKDSKVTFTSSNPAVVEVNEMGQLKAIALGKSTVFLQVDALRESIQVAVVEPERKSTTELPLLRFNPKRDASNKIIDKEILAYENSLGRKSKTIPYNVQTSYEGFVNLDLSTIPVVIYGVPLEEGEGRRIIAYAKETIADCPKFKEMLRKSGFSKITATEKELFGEMTPVLIATSDIDPEVSMIAMDEGYPEYGANMYVEFIHQKPKHQRILTQVEDFPSLKAFASLSLKEMEDFEEDLALRTLNRADSKKYSRMFTTKSELLEKTNLKWVYYTLREAPQKPFINAEINCPNGIKDITSKEMKAYLAYNGFDQEYYADSSANVVMVYNREGDFCQILSDTRTKRILMQLQLKRDLPNLGRGQK